MDFSLDDVEQDIKTRLLEAARYRKSAMHTPVVGSGGDMRVMVLREFDPESNIVRFHTDARSDKVEDICNDAAVSMVFYDPGAKIQIRAHGFGTIHYNDGIADAAWEQTTTFGKRCYLAEAAPGSTSDQPLSGLPAWVEGINPTEEQCAPGRTNFAVLRVEIVDFDWLYLSNKGNRRALISLNENRWLVP